MVFDQSVLFVSWVTQNIRDWF